MQFFYAPLSSEEINVHPKLIYEIVLYHQVYGWIYQSLYEFLNFSLDKPSRDLRCANFEHFQMILFVLLR